MTGGCPGGRNADVRFPRGGQLHYTSIRWTDFTENGPPTMGYYWPENDTQITCTDNRPSFYMPWVDGSWRAVPERHGG